MVPAYSQDSEIVGCAGTDQLHSGEGIFCRRTPDKQYGKEMAALKMPFGGAAWYPTGNKFYHGMTQTGADDGGLAVVIDPLTDVPKRIYVPSHDGQSGRRAFWNSAAGEIWIAVDTGNCFLRIDPTDDSVLGFIAGSAPGDFDFCTSNNCVYFSTSNAVYKVTSGGSVSTIYTLTDFQTAWGSPVPAQFGSLVYVDSLDLVLFLIAYPDGGYFFAWQIVPGTGVATPYASGVGGGPMYYTSQFDRIILEGGDGVLSSWHTDFTSPVPLGAIYDEFFSLVATDLLRAKGCYCDNVDKVALPVLTGALGARFETVNFYSGTDLGA